MKQRSVLIFEDDHDLAKQWISALEAREITALHTASIEGFLQTCAQRAFDALVCDIFVRDANGYLENQGGLSLISYCRNSILGKTPAWAQEVPIIAITGAARVNDFDILQMADSIGASTLLRKPITPEALASIVCEQIDHSLAESNPLSQQEQKQQ